MLVFLRLLEARGVEVTRKELFDECWGGAAVGDDSLNRAVAGARQMANAVGSSAVAIETIPRVGYRLELAPAVEVTVVEDHRVTAVAEVENAIEGAYDCWRLGLPTPDHHALEVLESVLAKDQRNAAAWGMYALLLRKAVEYAGPDDCAIFVRKCEQAARKSIALTDAQPDALVALAGIMPIFGNWQQARVELLEVLRGEVDHVPAAHDIAILEMSTGRPSAARPIIGDLIARDPLAATFYYKRMYHLWTVGELGDLDTVASRALQLWPRHPAIWSARLWTLIFTHRAGQALCFLEDETARPQMPPELLDMLRQTVRLAAEHQAGGPWDPAARAHTIASAQAAASRGPAQAVAALICLCALEAVDEAFEIAYGYYLGRGTAVVPLRHSSGDPSITDQHRRVTQPLFIPSAEALRQDSRFLPLCEEIGLVAYWERFGLTPDFFARG